MSNERPPFERDRAGIGVAAGGASNDVESGRATVEHVSSDVAKEFEFSHLVLGEQIPFAISTERVERTWARLAKSAPTLPVRRESERRLTGPLIAVAACAATFAAGVWVGEGNVRTRGPGLAASPLMSPEPVLVTLPSGGGEADLHGGARAAGHGAAGHGAAGHADPARQSGAAANGHGAAGDDDLRNEAPQVGLGVNEPSNALPSNALPSNVDGAPMTSPASSSVSARVAHGARSSTHLPLTEAAASGALPAPAHTDVAVAMTASPASAPAWQRLAYDGDYEGALAEITSAGGFERILQTASAEQLMLLSDVARGTGQQQRALAALRRIVSEHASDPVAPLAALNMGNLLDKMGDGAGATRAFAVYRALSPKGDFAEDALVRQIRSAVSAGQRDLARRLVHQYEVDFPEGRQADEVARWVEQIPTESEFGDAGAAQPQ